MRESKGIFANIDWTIILLYLVLIFIGWINIYAAVYSEEDQSIFSFEQNYGRQFFWILTSILIALFILMIDAKFFVTFAYLFYAISILSLVAVLFVGKEVGGSISWFQFGIFSIQPAEFAKFATGLVIAKYLSTLNIKISSLKTQLIIAILLCIPACLILLQHDTGSALVFLSIIFVLYREGLSGNILLIGLMVVVLFVLTLLINKFIIAAILLGIVILLFFFIKRTFSNIVVLLVLLIAAESFVFSVDYVFTNILEPHQKTRINVLLGKEYDPHGAGYNIIQSKIAIGSGGFFGKGFLKGTQTKYDFVPEQSTDFIFCTIGEEWGFVGSLTVILLFIALLARIVRVAERQRSAFGRIYGYCVASILFIHFTINIGMTVGLFPIIGIPLPFFSYGGSSLWAFTILLFIFLKLDSNRYNIL